MYLMHVRNVYKFKCKLQALPYFCTKILVCLSYDTAQALIIPYDRYCILLWKFADVIIAVQF